MARELWVPADKVTVTQTAYTNGESAITVSGDFRRHTPAVQTGFVRNEVDTSRTLLEVVLGEASAAQPQA